MIVIPGLTTGDISTTLLRRTLKRRGFQPEGWRQGINLGADAAKLKTLEARLEELHRQTGKKVVLIGWSLGGLYARVLAHRLPERVDMVVTVASPFSGDRHANRAWKLYEAINDHTVDNPPFAEQVSAKPPVPTLAVWSARDGIVAPYCSRGEEGESDATLRIDAQHFTLGTSAACIEKILAKMAELDPEKAATAG
ncbi:alpha/beta fold hydrolase [Aurantiacibacter poecillastricola]|uniref:alpha/beta fold hydrolase n=1 Tax=Aurantiacibacter poecillastricola TaxID=3064385 RepID=UPI00273F8F33|nr:alpha/beta fold hydrolase [Aurantiacibacter sp. 219JJ12-13]MDP5262140.1 alpha/beta fold hydrolase [Aurantiacibacter sp. 219JJ12-13]